MNKKPREYDLDLRQTHCKKTWNKSQHGVDDKETMNLTSEKAAHKNTTISWPSACSDSNGKEKDYESGFHYYGARYYWSEVLTGWLSVDPMMDKYPNISPYNYCTWNPVKLVDPDGRDGIPHINKRKKTITVEINLVFYMPNPGHVGRKTIDQWITQIT